MSNPVFPRTMVGGISLPRLLIGTNWFLGWSHTSVAKDRFIKEYQTRARVAEVLTVFLERGIDAVMGMPEPLLRDAVKDAEDRVGRPMRRIFTPHFNILPGGPPENEPERVFDRCRELRGRTGISGRHTDSGGNRRRPSAACGSSQSPSGGSPTPGRLP